MPPSLRCHVTANRARSHSSPQLPISEPAITTLPGVAGAPLRSSGISGWLHSAVPPAFDGAGGEGMLPLNALCFCRCAPGYYGNPLVIGSFCQPCDCSGNTDPNMLFSDCDPLTGACSGCMHHTAGPRCELCAPGYHGDAVEAKNCTCECHTGHGPSHLGPAFVGKGLSLHLGAQGCYPAAPPRADSLAWLQWLK